MILFIRYCTTLVLVVSFHLALNTPVSAFTTDNGKTADESSIPITSLQCSNGDFTCSSGSIQCILENKKCDGKEDCEDGSDEHHCHRCSGFGNYFYCGNNQTDCIAAHWRCDGEKDCKDGSDEENCVQTTNNQDTSCGEREFECSNGMCIPMIWKCDGHHDCLDRRDEDESICREINLNKALTQDTANSNSSINKSEGVTGVSHYGLFTHDSKICEDDGFECSSGECVPRRWVCDGTPDCPDQDDELVCPHADESCLNLTKNGFETFLCEDGFTCIELTKICDDRPDCPDHSDEGPTCKTSCENMGCEQTCMPSPIHEKGTCFCTGDYILSNDNKTCIDVDECKIFGSCSQDCINMEGTYDCACQSGYTDVNGTCKALGNDPALLFFSSRSNIRGIELFSKNRFDVTNKSVNQAIGVTYDRKYDRVYWSDVKPEGAIYSSFMNGSDVKLFLKEKVVMVESMVVDYIARNLYFTDSVKKVVGVCALDSQPSLQSSNGESSPEPVCSTILINIDQPREIALYPPGGLIFYTNWGKMPHIGKAGMDGMLQEAIISEDIGWPNGIVVDVVLKRIFWSDAKHGRIETAFFDGSDRRTIFSQTVQHPFSLAIFEDTLFWSDWESQQVQSCNKFDGDDHRTVVSEQELHGINIYHPLLEANHTNPCIDSKCSHLCLLASGGKGYTCACPSPRKWHLAEDRKTCHYHFDTESKIPMTRDFAYNHLFVNSEKDIPILTRSSITSNETNNTAIIDVGTHNESQTIKETLLAPSYLKDWPYEGKVILGIAIVLMIVIIILLVYIVIKCGLIPLSSCCSEQFVWKKPDLLPVGLTFKNPAFGMDNCSSSRSPSRNSICSSRSSGLDRIAPRSFSSGADGLKDSRSLNGAPRRGSQDNDSGISGNMLSTNNLEGWNRINFDEVQSNPEVLKDERNDNTDDTDDTKPGRFNLFNRGESKLSLPLWQKDTYARFE